MLLLALINTWFIAKTVYPDLFDDIYMTAKTNEVTKMFLGEELSDEKTLAMLLALCMVFALCACGGKTETPTPAIEAPAYEAVTVEALEEYDITVYVCEATNYDGVWKETENLVKVFKVEDAANAFIASEQTKLDAVKNEKSVKLSLESALPGSRTAYSVETIAQGMFPDAF